MGTTDLVRLVMLLSRRPLSQYRCKAVMLSLLYSDGCTSPAHAVMCALQSCSTVLGRLHGSKPENVVRRLTWKSL